MRRARTGEAAVICKKYPGQLAVRALVRPAPFATVILLRRVTAQLPKLSPYAFFLPVCRRCALFINPPTPLQHVLALGQSGRPRRHAGSPPHPPTIPSRYHKMIRGAFMPALANHMHKRPSCSPSSRLVRLVLSLLSSLWLRPSSSLPLPPPPGPHAGVPEEVHHRPGVGHHLLLRQHPLRRGQEPHPGPAARRRPDQVPHLLPDHGAGLQGGGVRPGGGWGVKS